jgi:transposase
MRDIEFYAQVLGLGDPWFVTDVELQVEPRRIDIFVSHEDGRLWRCPKCDRELPVYDHEQERSWRHLDTGGFPTYIKARPPRVACPQDGVHQVLLPWAEPKSRHTKAFERFCIDVLKETDISGAANILKMSWDQCFGIMERAVARGKARKESRVPALIGVDEKAARKGHSYLTLVYSITDSTVEYIADDRKQSSLDGYFSSFSPEERERIQAVAMDMWEPYINSVTEHLTDAKDKIVFDRFHVAKHMGQAVDTVRKRENRELRAAGDDSLVGSKYMWLHAERNLPDRHKKDFGILRSINFKTARAWGDQRDPGGAVELSPARMGHQVLQAVVLLGYPLAPAAGHRCRLHDQAPPLRHPQLLLRSENHERRSRRPQFEDPDHQEDGLRIPQPRALQDRHLLPLWWATALP